MSGAESARLGRPIPETGGDLEVGDEECIHLTIRPHTPGPYANVSVIFHIDANFTLLRGNTTWNGTVENEDVVLEIVVKAAQPGTSVIRFELLRGTWDGGRGKWLIYDIK